MFEPIILAILILFIPPFLLLKASRNIKKRENLDLAYKYVNAVAIIYIIIVIILMVGAGVCFSSI